MTPVRPFASRFASAALPLRRRRSRCAPRRALAAWPFGASGPAEPTHEIKAPHYGDALFYFFQDRYFTSITTLMASQQFDRVVKHDDEAEILRGGMLASYGLTKEAGEIFAQADRSRRVARGARPRLVLPRQDPLPARLPAPRPRRRSRKIESKLPPQLEEERGLLLANLLMAARRLRRRRRRAERPAAEGHRLALRSLQPRHRAAQVGRRRSAARSCSTSIGKESAPTEEYRSLRDRANVALGFSALSENRPKDARDLSRAGSPAEPAGEQGAARLRLGRRRARAIRSSRSCRGRSSRSATSATPRCSRRRSRCPTPTPSSAPTASRCSATRPRSPPSSARAPTSTSRSRRSAPAR